MTAARATARPAPSIALGTARTALPAAAAAALAEVVVDSNRSLPDMFELTFFDPAGDVLDIAGIELGEQLTISSAGAMDGAQHTLIVGEVTAIEGTYGELPRTVVRGYSADHRLMRNRRTAVFRDTDDADIARRVATENGLSVAPLAPMRVRHEVLGQVNQTDWEFLRGRATEAGYDFGVRDGKFFLRTRDDQGTPVALRLGHNLFSFRPRITAGNLGEGSEVRVWDPMDATVRRGAAAPEVRSARLPGTTVPEVSAPFRTGTRTPPAGTGRHGPPPEPGHVVHDRPVATGAAGVDAVAPNLATYWGDTVAEADGVTAGDPRLLAGVCVEVTGVPRRFAGRWSLSRARHVFGEFGYQTELEVSGGQDRSLLGMVTGASGGDRGRLPGLLCGIVSDIADPLGKGRVTVDLPLLSPGFTTDWAPVAQLGAGSRSGAVFGHEVGDEVLVGFECADPRRPYVLGGIVNNHSTHSVGGAPVLRSTPAAQVWRGLVSPAGNRIAFHDELPPGGGAPRVAEVVIGTASGDLAFVVDRVAGTVTVRCDPASGAGQLNVECGQGGAINVRAGTGGTVTVDGGRQLDLTAEAINIRSVGDVTVAGRQIKLN